MSLMENLEGYYRKQGISSLVIPFQCKHRGDCGRDCEGFVEAQAAFVGVDYDKCGKGKGLMPRLLFLSLDPGYGNGGPEERSVLGQQRYEKENYDHATMHKDKHWYWTHEIARSLLDQFKPGVRREETCRYFAHTNSAKCCMNKAGKKKADWQMFKNCREYIPDEIELFEPDVLITQGDEAAEAIALFPCSKKVGEQKGCGYAILKVGDRDVLRLRTYHPNQRRGLFALRSQPCVPGWAKIVGEFWRGNFE